MSMIAARRQSVRSCKPQERGRKFICAGIDSRDQVRLLFKTGAFALYSHHILNQLPVTSVQVESSAVKMTYLQQNQAPRVIIINIVTLIVAVIAVILRLISRRLSAAHFWWDDGLIIVGLFLDFGSSAFNFTGKM